MDFLSQLKISTNNNGVSTGTEWLSSKNEKIESYSPVDGKLIASVSTINKKNYEAVIQKSQEAFLRWHLWPAPKRGEIVQIGRASCRERV